MAEISKQQLNAIMTHASEENIERYLPALNEALPKYGIDTPMRVAHFIAQIAHESGSLTHSIENLNYSSVALRSVFGKYFTSDEIAEEYHRKPENIANIVYANRMGNGDTESGDGWRYRGRGLIQLTGKDNYSLCGKAIGVDLVNSLNKLVMIPVCRLRQLVGIGIAAVLIKKLIWMMFWR